MTIKRVLIGLSVAFNVFVVLVIISSQHDILIFANNTKERVESPVNSVAQDQISKKNGE
jgi:hypothetical protein